MGEQNDEEPRVIIKATRDFHKTWLLDKHQESLEESFYQPYSDSMDYEIVVENQDSETATAPANTSQPKPENDKQNVKKVFPFAKDRQLNPAYTFDNFIVGPSNNYAFSAAQAVAEEPAEGYNPLFIHGNVGLGKTHLLQAIGHKVNTAWEQAAVKYVSAEKFTNQIIQAIQENNRKEFKYRYRSTDLLLVDDVQFFSQTERAQEEFFHTFNSLHEANRQLIISSDRPPKEIPTLEERLRSRFEWGLITDIQKPDLETRIAILRKKADLEDLEIPNEVIINIANKIQSNIRELEGALIKVIAYSSLVNKEIDIDLAEEALKDLVDNDNSSPREITIDLIKKEVANYYKIEVKEMESKKRTQKIVFPRQIAMYLSRNMTDASLPQIGDEFGGRDHTTVIHSHNKIKEKFENDIDFQKTIKKLKSKIKRG